MIRRQEEEGIKERKTWGRRKKRREEGEDIGLGCDVPSTERSHLKTRKEKIKEKKLKTFF